MTVNPRSSIARQNPAGYTASQIANAARLGKRNVLRTLAEVPTAGSTFVQGNEAPVWTVDVLPASIHKAIASHASANGLSLADYLDAFVKPWKPALPISRVDERCIEDAKKLRDALLPALQRMDSKVLSSADRIRMGLEDYKRAFGHEISERHWQRLLSRTLWRDGGMEDFHRLEIYLPEKPKAKAEVQGPLPNENRFTPILEVIRACADLNAPTPREKAAIWLETFETYDSEAQTRREKRQWRRALVKFLYRHAPALAKSEHALRVAFDRKFERWLKADKSAAALLDRREDRKGVPSAEPIPQDDIDRLVWHAAANCGGRVAQAVREHAEKGERSGLTKETVELITRPFARKSHVNRRLADQLLNDVNGLMPFFTGKKTIDDATAHVERDYSKLVSMQVINADDFTFPVYFYVPDGEGWFTLTRGQCLILLDVRSWRVVAYSLQPDRNYNSLVIRTLMNRVCNDCGIPENWYFEMGIWKNALLVKGNPPAGWESALSWPEVKIGWENLGVKFRHAIRARTKPVERVGGLLQDLMHGIRGYCGRDERRDCPEVTKRAMQDVQFRRVNHPGELFLSFEEWDEQLGQLIERYNGTSQDGKVLNGLSPDEAFEKFWPTDNPPARLDANSWHLVAHYVRPVPVTTNGISFRIGNKKFVYRSERTGQDRGKTVLAWFDPSSPDLLCVTDANRKNPYLVERATDVDFLAEDGDPVFKRELAKAASHSKYSRARFHTLNAKFAPTFRRNVVDFETAETAQEITRQRTAKLAEQTANRAESTKARENLRRLGMYAPERLRPGQAEGLEEFAKLMRKGGEEQ